MNNEKVVLRGKNSNPQILRLSRKDAENVDKNRITHLTLKDGTIVNVEDYDETSKNPFISSSNSNQFLRNKPTHNSATRESYGRIVEDEANYRIYESCNKSKQQPQKLRAINQTTPYQKNPITFTNEPEVHTEVKVQTFCPYCSGDSGEGENVLRSRKIRSFGNKVYTIEPVPGLEGRFIKTVEEENDYGDEIIREDTPVFTFKSGAKQEGCQRFVYCSKDGGEYVNSSENHCCSQCGCSYIETPGYYCEKCGYKY